jgi:N-acetylmuramoyl-L-alanine amidase
MREIREIIWHCSASPEGVDLSTESIRAYHTSERGWSDIGYHYVIELSGIVRTGRPEAKAGAHCSGRNAYSIGICYVGGCEKDGRTPKDTRTPEQRAALYRITEELLQRYPRATVHGHNEFSSKACPSFDVGRDWSLRKHGGLSADITPGLSPEDMREEEFEE